MSKKRHTATDEPFFVVRTMRATMRDGTSVDPHAHSWHQLIYASAGVMTVTADRGLWIVPPHWAIWAPAGVQHAISFTGASEFATLYLRPSDWTDLPNESCVVSASTLLRELILHACAEGMLDRRNAVHIATALLIVNACRTRSVPALGLPTPTSDLLRRVAKACAEEHAESAQIARRHGIGLRTLERRFLAETGMSLGQWRRHAMFLEALRLLAQGKPVKQVATETGYSSASAFVAAFSQTFRTTPGRYFGSIQKES